MNTSPLWEKTEPISGAGLRFGIVVSRYHSDITGRLLSSAIRVLKSADVSNKDIEVVYVPGAFEIPYTAKQMGRLRRFDAVICLGAVIKGETPHFHYICSVVAHGVGQVALELSLPVIFGVLTTTTLEEAVERAKEDMSKGEEAARAAIEMAALYKKLKGS